MSYLETWAEAYLNGYELECSQDKQTWRNVTQEPFAGDGLYYRIKENKYNDAALHIHGEDTTELSNSNINKRRSFYKN